MKENICGDCINFSPRGIKALVSKKDGEEVISKYIEGTVGVCGRFRFVTGGSWNPQRDVREVYGERSKDNITLENCFDQGF